MSFSDPENANVERFSGYADLYDRYRPETPTAVLETIVGYTGSARPHLVVDLGSGTGLSTFAWGARADAVIGIEPSSDMRRQAEAKLAAMSPPPPITFRPGSSHHTGLHDEVADIVTCSQSFHWMEPVTTLAEAARILKPGGVFAAYDCDWPPVAGWTVEMAYTHFQDNVDLASTSAARALPTIIRWDKDQHLANLQASGHFRFIREVVLHQDERCDAERFVGLALSQGGYQSLLKAGFPLSDAVAALRHAAQQHFGPTDRPIRFSYRLRLGVK